MFYDALKEVCDKKKTTPSAVCDSLGLSRSNITKWKSGKYPRLNVVVAIANHLSVSPSRLIPKELKDGDPKS